MTARGKEALSNGAALFKEFGTQLTEIALCHNLLSTLLTLRLIVSPKNMIQQSRKLPKQSLDLAAFGAIYKS